MALSNPTALTSTTRFRPPNPRSHSRSPSRSPVRTAQFRAQHLDPLLRNLSPNSTLKALQTTETIPEGSAQDVLTKSIADATPSEREIGIRAAFAAQKLREWRNEISNWDWPNRRDRGLGAGFLPPHNQVKTEGDGSKRVYMGYLPLRMVDQYEQRIDEMRDAMESLEMEDIKDHVLAAHSGTSEASTIQLKRSMGNRASSYGRMRDFTALITATVIQALPDLAIVAMLLETWEARLGILRQLPMLLDVMEGTRRGLRVATSALKDSHESSLFTQKDFDETRNLLGDQVADFGSRIDKLLDMLQDSDDILPQHWIDSLETMELDYAAWVVDAQRAVTQNESGSAANRNHPEVSTDHLEPLKTEIRPPPESKPPALSTTNASKAMGLGASDIDTQGKNIDDELEEKQVSEARTKLPPPPLNLKPPSHLGHRRQTSDVSVADSAYSAFSSISEGEIVEARQTQVLPSPKVSLIDNPFTPTREGKTFFGLEGELIDRPPMVQRASTASIEAFSRDQVKKVDLRRSVSAELLAKITRSQSPDTTPSKALQRLTGMPPKGTKAMAEPEDLTTWLQMQHISPASTALPSPSLMVQPLRVQTTSSDDYAGSPTSPLFPTLPTRSSKRKSMATLPEPSSSVSVDSPVTPIATNLPEALLPQRPKASPKQPTASAETLESKIQDILLTLPTKIHLANDDGNPRSTQPSSEFPARASTPTPALMLSPAKQSRKSSAADTGVRVFHLHQHGQSRDAAPIKLFVRAVGENGERVMVRVGGGWADLGEYLKEYSAHHRSKSIADAGMELAQYPSKSKREPVPTSTPSTVDHSRRANGTLLKTTRRRSASQTSFDSARGRGRSSRSPSPPHSAGKERAGWTTPPVPPIPSSYTINSPTLSITTKANGTAETKIDDREVPPLEPPNVKPVSTKPPPVARSSTVTTPSVSTTTNTLASAPTTNGRYTPLGAAGPKSSNRRPVMLASLSNSEQDNEAWVQGMVGKARAVSNSHVMQGPATTTTTTTTTVTTSTPNNRRASAVPLTSSSENSSPALSIKGPKELERRKSRLGLGDVSGIKRVFLRRKSEKA